VFLWYLKAIPTWSGNGITSGLIKNNKSLLVLLDYFQFNLISSVPELLTNYASCVFLVTGIYLFFKRIRNLKNHHHYLIILFLFLSVYFLFELNMIEKTHDYYLMPFIPLIFLVVTYGVNYFYFSKYKKFVFFIVCIVPLTAWLRINTRWNRENPGFTIDYLTQKNYFQKIISTNDTCIIDYDESRFISLYYLKRKGYSLLENELNQNTLKELYLKGAKFLVSENPAFNTNDYPNFNFKNSYDENLKIFRIELK
jgi:4-amino-4-deoxy-L-arabinose transferase-like glycosyltransferase